LLPPSEMNLDAAQIVALWCATWKLTEHYGTGIHKNCGGSR